MVESQKILKKGDQRFLFQVELNWLSKQRGLLSANDVNGIVYVSTPSTFGGEGNDWSPEHLFLGSVSSCFMSTFLDFVKKLHFEISRFECDIIGQIELVEGKYQFTYINIYPTVYVADDTLKEKAKLALQKAQKYCLISNSIKAEVIYHGEVIKDPHPRFSNQYSYSLNNNYGKL